MPPVQLIVLIWLQPSDLTAGKYQTQCMFPRTTLAVGPREGKLRCQATRCYIEMPTTGLSSRAGRAIQCLEHKYLGLVLQTPHPIVIQFRYLLPSALASVKGQAMKTSMQSTNKPRPPVPRSMDVCDLGGGSGPLRLHTGRAKNLWVKKNHHTRGERLKIATYNVRTLLKDEHVQELEEELKENNMKWDVIGLGAVRRKEGSFTPLQSGHLLYHSDAKNGQVGVGFLVNNKWKDNITRVSSGSSRVAELGLRITDRYQLKIVQVYAPTTSHSDEETDNFYNTIDKILGKQTHYTIVMGTLMRKLEYQQIHQKGRQDASAWASEMNEKTLLQNGQHQRISRS